jgi:hypothetical protein
VTVERHEARHGDGEVARELVQVMYPLSADGQISCASVRSELLERKVPLRGALSDSRRVRGFKRDFA